MVALKIEEQKAFTEGLFIGEIFDKFLVQGSGDRDLEPVFHRRKDPSGIFFGRGARGEPDRRILFLEELKADLLLPDQGKTAAGELPDRISDAAVGKRPVCFRESSGDLVRIR